MKKLGWIVVPILIAAALFAIRMKRVQEVAGAPLVETVPLTVEVSTVTRAKVARTRHVLGTVIGMDEAELASRVMSQIIEITAREGESVGKHKILARLDPREFEDAVASAEAKVDAARQGLVATETAEDARRAATARDKKLFDAGAISAEQFETSTAGAAAVKAQLENARAGLISAEKALEQAQTRLKYCLITAPFSGKISRRLADPGDLAVPGKPLFALVHQDAVRVRIELPGEDLGFLHAGNPLKLTLNGQSLETRISRVFPALGNNHLISIEADLKDPPPGYISGVSVGADVQLGSEEGLSVSSDALLEGKRGSWVFIVEEADDASGIIQPRRVEILLRSAGRTLVSGDLQEGQVVVVGRPSRLMLLSRGMRVGLPDSGGPS